MYEHIDLHLGYLFRMVTFNSYVCWPGGKGCNPTFQVLKDSEHEDLETDSGSHGHTFAGSPFQKDWRCCAPPWLQHSKCIQMPLIHWIHWLMNMFPSKTSILWDILSESFQRSPSVQRTAQWSMRLGQTRGIDLCRCVPGYWSLLKYWKNMKNWMTTPTMQCAGLQDVGGKTCRKLRTPLFACFFFFE